MIGTERKPDCVILNQGPAANDTPVADCFCIRALGMEEFGRLFSSTFHRSELTWTKYNKTDVRDTAA